MVAGFYENPVLVTYRTTKLSNGAAVTVKVTEVLVTYRTTKLSN